MNGCCNWLRHQVVPVTGIARQLLEVLENIGINRNFIVGQCHDGAASIFGYNKELQKRINTFLRYISIVHHRLNLCIFKACNVKSIQAAITIMKVVSVFFQILQNVCL